MGQKHNGTQVSLEKSKRDQMLKLVTKGFYNELINYGVNNPEIVTVSANLLEEVIRCKNEKVEQSLHKSEFGIDMVEDNWTQWKSLHLDGVTIQPLDNNLLSEVVEWLKDPIVQNSFIDLFPKTVTGLQFYFKDSGRKYFAVYRNNSFAGIIGAENWDENSSKLEMRKFIGNAEMRGMGVGKKATFLFLYWGFIINNANKVFLNTCDVNIRNLNLNSKMGFKLEGILMEEVVLGNSKKDVVRMGLLKSRWQELYRSVL